MALSPSTGLLPLTVVGLLFIALQVWWIAALLRRQALARPLSEREFRRTLERIWARRS